MSMMYEYIATIRTILEGSLGGEGAQVDLDERLSVRGRDKGVANKFRPALRMVHSTAPTKFQ